MSLVKRVFLSPTYVCMRGVLATTVMYRSALSESSLRSAFRHACAQEGVGLNEGVAEEVFASALAEPGVFSLDEAKAQLRSSPAFTVQSGIVHMNANDKDDATDERRQLESVLMKIAARIPSSGVRGAQLQAMLEDEAPYFRPAAVGALSLRDAIQSYPHIFTIDADSTGRWIVKPTHATQSRGIDNTNNGPQRIVDFCRRKALMGYRGTYTPLLVAMQKTGITDKGLLRKLLMNKELSQVLQVKLSVNLKPKRSPVNAYCFIDGDEISAKVVENMCKELNISEKSTFFVARRPTSLKHDSKDIVAPENMPTYAILELKAKELILRQSVILQDIIYMCSSKQFSVYAEHVAKLNAFPDTDVYVCCPNRVKLIAEKKYVPL